MAFVAKLQSNLSAFYNSASGYTSSGYNWVKSSCSHVYSKMPAVSPAIKSRVSNALNTGKSFALRNNEALICGALVVTAGAVAYYIWKNTPQKLDVKMETIKTSVRLTFGVPKGKPKPLDIALTFVIDISGSMGYAEDKDASKTRAMAVHRALNTLVDDALLMVNGPRKAKVCISIISFDTNASVVTPMTKLDSTTIKNVKAQIQKLVPNGGGTNILNGLTCATQELANAASIGASHSVILLSDGEDNETNDRTIIPIHAAIAQASAKLFAVGIGEAHKQNGNKVKLVAGFKGKYIDTTDKGHSIEKAVAEIYESAMSSFQEVVLTSSLPGTVWSVVGSTNVEEGGVVKCKLGSQEEGKTISKIIEINWEKLKADDRKDPKFTLHYTDSYGRPGQMDCMPSI